jgi:hypothetical protein
VEIVQKAELPPDRPGEQSGGTYGMSFEPTEAPALRPTLEPGGRKNLPAIVHIFPYGVSRSRLERAIVNLRVPAVIARDYAGANLILALKATFRKDPARLTDARSRGMNTHVVKSNTYIQIESAVREIFGMQPILGQSDEDSALEEAESAIEQVQQSGHPVELAPQNAYIRRLQHQLVDQAQLNSQSLGDEPRRRLKILPGK